MKLILARPTGLYAAQVMAFRKELYENKNRFVGGAGMCGIIAD